MPRPPPSPAAQAPTEPANVQSEFVVILAALLCALICILGLFAVARCTLFHRNAASSSSSSAGASNKGLKKKTLRSLPKFTYTASAVSSKQQGDGNVGVTDDDDGNEKNECVICLAEFVDGEEIRVLPQCGHRFHVTCVDTWLAKHSSCPKCRRVLVVGKKCGRCGAATAEELKRTCDPGTSTSISTSGANFLP